METNLSNEGREKIFSLFTKNKQLKFSDIEKATGMRSNHLNYYLETMINQGLIVKVGEFYELTKEAESIIPVMAHLTGKEQGSLPIVVVAILDKNKICLLKREKRPYKDFWGLIGGKLKLHESIEECALRETREETGLDCKFDRMCSVLHERIREEEVKHSFVIFLCKVFAKNDKIEKSEEGELEWFDLDKLPKNIIPSDKMMIQELLECNFCFKEILVNEKDGKFTRMDVK